jgi:ketosteroid isomerase-like protein
MGTHPLAGHDRSKMAFLAGPFAKLGIVKGAQAVVELHSGATAKNRMRFDNRYRWVVYFRDNVIVRGRAYLDSAMVARVFAENSIS